MTNTGLTIAQNQDWEIRGTGKQNYILLFHGITAACLRDSEIESLRQILSVPFLKSDYRTAII